MADAFECKARKSNNHAGEQADCDWPVCGCDPVANKVIDALEESGTLSVLQAREGDSWESVKALPVSTPFPVTRAHVVDVYDGKNDTMRKAADLIIALEAEIERLKADLNDRDDFLCFTNNWDEFTEWIAGDKSRTALGEDT